MGLCVDNIGHSVCCNAKIATSDRGYNALGGEVFMLMIPFFVWIAPEIKKSIKEFKDVL